MQFVIFVTLNVLVYGRQITTNNYSRVLRYKRSERGYVSSLEINGKGSINNDEFNINESNEKYINYSDENNDQGYIYATTRNLKFKRQNKKDRRSNSQDETRKKLLNIEETQSFNRDKYDNLTKEDSVYDHDNRRSILHTLKLKESYARNDDHKRHSSILRQLENHNNNISTEDYQNKESSTANKDGMIFLGNADGNTSQTNAETFYNYDSAYNYTMTIDDVIELLNNDNKVNNNNIEDTTKYVTINANTTVEYEVTTVSLLDANTEPLKPSTENEVTINDFQNDPLKYPNNMPDIDKWVWTNDDNMIDTTTIMTPTLDDRAAFAGDQCASGMARIAGKCVVIDSDPQTQKIKNK